jgi:hypothetical protein
LRRAPHEAHDAAALTELLMLNCHAPSALAHGFIPRLRARGKGGIVFTSSVEGALGGPYSAAYSSSKAMVTALGEALWGELADTEIDVLTLCPGKTVSEALVKQGFDPSMLDDAMPAREVARLALDHITDGPTYISSEYYAAMIERMSALPRRQALLASAAAMKKHMAARDASLFREDLGGAARGDGAVKPQIELSYLGAALDLLPLLVRQAEPALVEQPQERFGLAFGLALCLAFGLALVIDSLDQGLLVLARLHKGLHCLPSGIGR